MSPSVFPQLSIPSFVTNEIRNLHLSACECADSDLFYAKTGSDFDLPPPRHAWCAAGWGLSACGSTLIAFSAPFPLLFAMSGFVIAHKNMAVEAKGALVTKTVSELYTRILPSSRSDVVKMFERTAY